MESFFTNQVTLPYEGNPKRAAKEYGLTLLSTSQTRFDKLSGITIATFSGTKDKLLNLLEEYGGEENAIYTLDEPYGRIL